MKVICAWCGTILKEGQGPVGHGICVPCALGLFEESSNLQLQVFNQERQLAPVDLPESCSFPNEGVWKIS